MIRYFLSSLILISCFNLYGQDETPSSAPKVNAFSINADNLGTLANSVNLFTGDLNLPLNIVSIPGQSGLGIDLSIFYNSNNVQNLVDKWNLEAPTGVLGLGWSMSYPMIVVDNKMTGARDDDDFYFVEGGASTKLICVGNSSGVKSFKTKTLSNWTVSYTSSTERWEIIKDDGTKYTYGDLNSNRNTVQWIVKWGNWIGSSKESYLQQRQSSIWNLSEVQNLWGQKITYTYLSEENSVGAGTVLHTEASYLQKITDSWGREAELVYKNKLADEFADPHIELTEPDAYQERYEKKYLDRVYVKNNGLSFYEIRFNYATNLFGSGNLTKRVLTSITKVVPSGEQQPSISFNYLTSGATKAALNSISTSNGGTVSFQYHAGLEITNSSRELLNVQAPAGYEEPTFIVQGDDYLVVTWRQLDGTNHTDAAKPVAVYAYQYDGRWVGKSLGNIGPLTTAYNNFTNQNFITVSRKDFFAILEPSTGNDYYLRIWHKSEEIPGEWRNSVYYISLDTHDNTKEALLAGDNFVAVSNNNGKILRYVWNGIDWNSSTVTESVNKHYTVADNNYILSHNTGPNPDEITLYYLDYEKKWQSISKTTSFNQGSGESYWHNSGLMAFVMANGANEFVYGWDENYSAIGEYNTGFQLPDYSFVYLTGESQITIVEPTANSTNTIRALRYDGYTWNSSGGHHMYYSTGASAGYDLFVWSDWPSPDETYIREFDPNIGAWKSPLTFTKTAYNYAGINSFILGGKGYYRTSAASWKEIVTFSLGTRPMMNGFVSSNLMKYIKNGTYTTPDSDTFSGSWDAEYDISESSAFRHQYLIGDNTIVTHNFTPTLESTAINLYRSINYNVKGKLKDYPVTVVTVNDGIKTYNTAYSYDPAKAVFDPSGSTTLYNKVTVINGSASEASKPFGYTENYFYNGLSETELGDSFPHDVAWPGNAHQFYKQLTGQSYRVNVFNTNATLVASTTNYWNVAFSTITNSQATTVDQGYLARPFKTINISDGIETRLEYGFNSTSKQINSQRMTTYSPSADKEVINIEYTYAWEKYPSCLSKNIWSPVVETKKSINGGSYTESSVTRWKDWTCSGSSCPSSTVPSPVDNYTWKGTNTSVFSWWDVATQTPSSDWTFQGKITVRDNTTGIELEKQSKGLSYSSVILDQNKLATVASVANASLDKIAFTSFEDADKGYWNWTDGSVITATSKTGDKHMNLGTSGLTKSGLTSSEKYVVSLWAKSSGGSLIIDGVGTINLGTLSDWTLFQYTVTGLTSLNIRKSGSIDVLIDEVKFYPSMAMISTSTFHPVFGVTSTTNTNEQTSYTTYDDFGRLKNLLDENRNIIQSYQYNTKK